jgi:hypothetical protein
MGSSLEKCEICNVEVPKNAKLDHIRFCKAEEIKRKTNKNCPKCKLLVPNEEFEDHMLCHSFEEQSGGSNVNQVTINYISNRNNIGNQNNYFSSKNG